MSRIYDSSALTQRRRDQAQAGSFINRIQNPNTPQTSYGPLQGNYDASIMNSVKMGQPKEFYRNSGCVIISNGCPCPPIAVDEIISGSGPTPPVILVPGPVSNIQVEYGSVIVTWNAPTEGGPPTSYTVSAIPLPGGTTITVTGVSTTTYSFATGALDAGTVYEMSVIGVNAAGTGPTSSPSSPISGPYSAASGVNTSITTPNTISINFSAYDFDRGLPPTQYTIIQYVNGTKTSTTIGTYTTNSIVVNNGLNGTDLYSFQFQLSRPADNKYTSYTSLTTPTRIYPAGPTGINYSNLSTTGIQIRYSDFSAYGYDLTGATCTITNGTTTLSIQANSLTNTSVIVERLSPATTYDNYTISFSKSPYNTSAASSLTTFIANGIAPSNIVSVSYTTYSSYTTFNTYNRTNPGEFDFGMGGVILSIPNVPSPTIDVISFSAINIGNLSAGTTYNGCTMTLTNQTGVRSDPSAPFTIITRSTPPFGVTVSSTTDTTATCAIGSYSGFIGPITQVKAYNNASSPQYAELSVAPYTPGSDTFTITGLLQSTPYEVVITVSNGTYTSVYSNPFQFTTRVSPITGILAVYGTSGTDVTWDAPATGGTPTSYTITATPISGSIVTVTGITTPRVYSFPVGGVDGLTPGDLYDISVIGVNAAGDGLPPLSTPSIYAPYDAPQINSVTTGTIGTISIDVSSYAPFNSTNYVLTVIINGIEQTTKIPGSATVPSIISVSLYNGSPLIGSNTYSFILQLVSQNQYSTLSSTTSPIYIYPAGPTGINYSNLSTTGIQINYDNFSTIGYDLTGATCTITNRTTTLSIQAGSVTNTSVIVEGLSPGTTYDGYTIAFSKSPYNTSAASDLASFTTLQPVPIMQQISNISWTTAELNFSPYTFGNQSDPTGGIVTSGTRGNISVNPVISTTSVTIQYLEPGTTYNDLNLVLTGSGGIQSQPAAVSTFITSPPTGNLGTISLISFTDTSASYTVEAGFTWAPSASYVIGNLGSNPTQQFSSSVTTSSPNLYNVTITGLTSNTTYTNIKIALTDGGSNFSNTGSGQSFTTKVSPSVAPTMIIIDDPPRTRADVSGIYNSSTTTVTITFRYSQYTAFTPTSGELFDSSNSAIGTFVSADNISLVISGISVNYYTDYTIKLYGDNNANTNATTPFNFSAIPIIDAGQNPIPNPNPITISYLNMSNFSFDVSSGSIYVPSLSNFPYSSEPGASATSSNFSPSGSGTYYNCYIYLINTSNNTVTLPSNTFTIDIGYPPPTQISTSSGETSVTISYNTYTIFSPSSGVFYYNGSPFGTPSSQNWSNQMIVDGLSSGTSYDNCYITVSDGTNTSNPSSSFGFSTTSPPPPEAPNVTSTNSDVNYVTIIYDQFTSFTPTTANSSVYLNTTQFRPTFISNTSMIVFGLSPNTTYNNSYIILGNGSSTSSNSNNFDFYTNSSPTPEAPYVDTTNISTGTNDVTINYTFNEFFAEALYSILIINNGAQSIIASSIINSSMTVTGLSSGTTYNNCSIILGNAMGTDFSSPSNTFDFTTQSPPPPPSYPAPDVNASGISTGTDSVTIPYSQYTAFSPANVSGGTLYTNYGSFSSSSQISDTEMTIYGLSSGTQYDNCYITLTDISNTSDPSHPTYPYFSFTTSV